MIHKLASRVVDFLASFNFACILFLLLAVLTLLGTLEQVEVGLFDVQKKYFESFFLVHWLFGRVPIPLPGVYLLLSLLAVNLLVGGFIRMRRTWSRAGILLIHTGMALLLVAGFVKQEFSEEGHVRLFEGQSASTFQSYHDWEIAIAELGSGEELTEHVITGDQFMRAAVDNEVSFRSAEIPFVLTVYGLQRNAVIRAADSSGMPRRVVDGFYLEPRPPDRQAELNQVGLYATVRSQETGKQLEAVLWGGGRFPWTFRAGGRDWAVDLDKARFSMPFSVQLDNFERELYPNTSIPKVFMSEITKVENGARQPVKITMNEPLRHKGYTLYQTSWGPQNGRPGDAMYSIFSVVRNPADQYPLYACIVIAMGMLWHFGNKLNKHLQKEVRARA